MFGGTKGHGGIFLIGGLGIRRLMEMSKKEKKVYIASCDNYVHKESYWISEGEIALKTSENYHYDFRYNRITLKEVDSKYVVWRFHILVQ